MLHDLWTTYSTLSQLTPREQYQTHCSNPNHLPNHYLTYIVHSQIPQQIGQLVRLVKVQPVLSQICDYRPECSPPDALPHLPLFYSLLFSLNLVTHVIHFHTPSIFTLYHSPSNPPNALSLSIFTLFSLNLVTHLMHSHINSQVISITITFPVNHFSTHQTGYFVLLLSVILSSIVQFCLYSMQ